MIIREASGKSNIKL